MTSRDRRTVLLGAVVIAVAVLTLRVIPAAARSVTARRAALAERVHMLAQARGLAAAIPQLDDSLEAALRELAARTPQLVSGATRAEATAAFSAYLALLAAQAELHVRALQPVTPDADDVFDAVGMRAELEGATQAVAAFLKEAEAGPPLLAIRSISVTAMDEAGPPSVASRVRIELECVAWRLSGEKEGP